MDAEPISSRRLAAFFDFARSFTPPPPAGVLEVGCGEGDLARALARAEYSVTAIDPEAPRGAIFRRVGLEDFDDAAGFDVVVASVALHHIEPLGPALAKIEDLLRPGGVLIVEEFAKERLTGATAEWYYLQRRALAAVGADDEPVDDEFEAWLSRWKEEHDHIHSFAALQRELDIRFRERYLGWTPYLYDYRLRDALEPVERELIESGAIAATGVRYVGERRTLEGRTGAGGARPRRCYGPLTYPALQAAFAAGLPSTKIAFCSPGTP
jgi:SAM-dependent methyltransferase